METLKLKARLTLRTFFDIRRGELIPALLMSFVLFLIIATFGMVKPVRTSLFLQEFGAKNLPYVYIATALLTAVLVNIYSRLLDRFGGPAITLLTNLFLAGSVAAFWWLFRQFDWIWLYGLFFIWVNIYTIMANTVFWMSADAYYTPREAKRIYGFINSAGTLGGIAGGLAVSALAAGIGTENLLLVSAALLVVAGLITYFIRHRHAGAGKAEPEKARAEGGERIGLGAVMKWRYARYIAIILGVGVLISNVVDFQFNVVVERAFASKDEKTAFLGGFFAWVNGLTFVLQFFLTARLLRAAGVGVALLLLPISMLGGLAGMAFAPGLAAATVLRTIDGSVRYSIEQSTRDILYLPIPARVMYKVKAVIDMFVQRLAKGVGSILILAVTAWTGLDLSVLTIIALALAGFWTFAALRVKREYVEELRGFLSSAKLGEEARHPRRIDRLGASQITGLLESGEEEEIEYALSMLEGQDLASVKPALYNLVERSAPHLKARTLHLLAEAGDTAIRALAEKLLEEEQAPELQAEAVHYLCMSAQECSSEKLDGMLASPKAHLRGAALACVVNCGGAAGTEIAAKTLRRMIDDRGPSGVESRKQAARALAHIRPPSPLHSHLATLIRDEDAEVVIAALESAGQTQRRDLIPLIIERLCCERTRDAALKALRSYGPRIVGTLRDYLLDDQCTFEIRGSVAWALASIGDQAAADALMAGLEIPEDSVRFEVIRSLNRLRNERPELEFDRARIEDALNREVSSCSRVLARLRAEASGAAVPAGDAVFPAIESFELERARVRERIFRLLGLIYSPEDIYRAFLGLNSSERDVRATAVEFLDNLLEPGIKKRLLPVIDDEVPIEDKLRAIGARSLGLEQQINREGVVI